MLCLCLDTQTHLTQILKRTSGKYSKNYTVLYPVNVKQSMGHKNNSAIVSTTSRVIRCREEQYWGLQLLSLFLKNREKTE